MNAPTDEGFYWATSVGRRTRNKFPFREGQIGGVRGIVRVFRYDGEEEIRVQSFGGRYIKSARDYKNWEGPIGDYYQE